MHARGSWCCADTDAPYAGWLDSSGEAYQDSLPAAREQVCAVWAERQAADWAGMPVQGLLGQGGVSDVLLLACLLR